jgi:hypothetical protein
MQRVEVGRIVVGSVWAQKRSGRRVRVSHFTADGHSLQERVVYVYEDGRSGEANIQGFWLRFSLVEGPPVTQETETAPTTKVAGQHESGAGW